MAASRTDYDSPWKEALEQYFPDFLQLLAPWLYQQIDWAVAPVFLDKELQALARDSATGKRYVDKLVRVLSKNQEPIWLLIHIEVQGGRLGVKGMHLFTERMFTYYCRLRLQHLKGFEGRPMQINSLGILTASRRQRRGKTLGSTLSYSEGTPGQNHVQFTFPVIHLDDWLSHWDELEARAATNPFAVLVMAQLQAQQTRKNDEQRLVSKIRIIKLLYRYKYSKADIQNLFRLVDWMMDTPEALTHDFDLAIITLEKEHNVTYVTSLERLWEKRGMEKWKHAGKLEGKLEGKQEGIQEGETALLQRLLTRKFGTLSADILQRLQTATLPQLEIWSLNILDATDLNDVFTD